MAENHRNRGWKWVFIVAVVVMGLGSGIWYWQHSRDDSPQYETVAIQRGDILQVVTATGALNPVTNVTVGCQVSGRISKLYVDYNSQVKADQLIAEIDPRTYQAQVDQATADLANAKANLELQQVEARRSSDLFTNKLISGSDYDTAIANLHEAEATVQIKEAALSNAQANLSYCKIYSPVNGVVISRNVDVGQTVAASLQSPTLFQIANSLTEMQIDANVDEADIGGVKEGQNVDFTVDAYPNRTFHGIVTQVRNAPTTLNNVVTYDTVIGVPNPDLKLKPGMTATVSIIVADHKNVLEIPNAVLRFQPQETGTENAAAGGQVAQASTGTNRFGGHRPGGFGRGRGRGGEASGEQPVVHTVYMLAKDDDGGTKLEPVQIKTDITDNIYTEVLSGLKEGDQVVMGLQIPGLSSSQEVNNPFAFRRRF
ncbi:MAG TPA: efflux RND transporter periplasmic adaptor subunit [Verrucomicrobiae bacterium]|nr:efflux RND transporter periplasmic adaptor subunit [Verrucomicrobiae bacterium]